MKYSLRLMLGAVLDYAGIFPPAALTLRDALVNYDHYIHDRHGYGWMLGRFVCPASRFPEVDALYRQVAGRQDALWWFSALGRGAESEAQFRSSVTEDLIEVRGLADRLGGRVCVQVFETRLPPAVLAAGREAVHRTMALATGLWDQLALPGPRLSPSLFFEVPLEEDWKAGVGLAIAAAAEQRRSCPSLGLKLRTGGVEAHQIPTVEQVAFFIAACRDADVPFKATAGLHHPLRHDSREVGAKMHGFINVFLAAVLARMAGFSQRRLEDVLEDEDAAAFRFEDDLVEWRGQRVSELQICGARWHFAISFGSCSLMEPVEDLRKLGWF